MLLSTIPIAVQSVSGLDVASRGGALFALALFGAIFALLGWGVRREMRNRSVGSRASNIAGMLLFGLPLLLVYTSSLSGFYQIRREGDRIVVSYLLPMIHRSYDAGTFRAAEVRHAFKNRWRVYVQTGSGTVVSAQAARGDADAAARWIRETLVR